MATSRRRSRSKGTKVVVKPHYVVEDLPNPPESEVKAYRTVRQGNHLVRVAVLKRKGPRGGRTVATSIWHPKSERKSASPSVQRALRRARRSGRR